MPLQHHAMLPHAAPCCPMPCPPLPSAGCWPHHPACPAAPHHALDDAPLLVVLLAKEGGIRLHNVEQLGHHLLGQEYSRESARCADMGSSLLSTLGKAASKRAASLHDAAHCSQHNTATTLAMSSLAMPPHRAHAAEEVRARFGAQPLAQVLHSDPRLMRLWVHRIASPHHHGRIGC